MKNLKLAIEKLNESSIYKFEINEKDKRIYDREAVYSINYVEDHNIMMGELAQEFGFNFEPKMEDEIFEQLESAAKKDRLNLEWYDSTSIGYYKA